MMRRFIACLVASCIAWAPIHATAALHSGAGVATSISSNAFPILAPDGLVGVPSYSFSSSPTSGLYWSTSSVNIAVAGARLFAVDGSVVYTKGSLNLGNGTLATNGTVLISDAADTLAQKNGAAAQARRLYFTTTGPVYFQETARTAGVLFTGVGGAMQLSATQTTAPTCTANCGTSPTVAGSDTFMRVTMGATGVPASGWVVTFNGTWPAAPVCIVQSALSTMVVGKMPIAVQVSTTTITVTTNGTAPATSDQYNIQCGGVS